MFVVFLPWGESAAHRRAYPQAWSGALDEPFGLQSRACPRHPIRELGALPFSRTMRNGEQCVRKTEIPSDERVQSGDGDRRGTLRENVKDGALQLRR